jgi:hypothetical protein
MEVASLGGRVMFENDRRGNNDFHPVKLSSVVRLAKI